MNVMADIQNGGENTPASGLQINSPMPAPAVNPSSAVTGATSNLINSAAIANVAGQETSHTQRFNPLYVNPSGRINQPGSDTVIILFRIDNRLTIPTNFVLWSNLTFWN